VHTILANFIHHVLFSLQEFLHQYILRSANTKIVQVVLVGMGFVADLIQKAKSVALPKYFLEGNLIHSTNNVI
jgi:hypothetical protein